MEDEIICSRSERENLHDGRCRGPFDFVGKQVLMGFAVFMAFFLVIMAADGLHWLTGGKVPELIEWHPKKAPFHDDVSQE